MPSMQVLCERLLESTRQLEAAVHQPDSDAETWEAVLLEREKIMAQISDRLAAGEELTAELRDTYVRKADEINRRVLALMETRREAVYQQIAGLQRTKQVRKHYVVAGPNGYGAFFDQRK